jgi:hypothetical protein
MNITTTGVHYFDSFFPPGSSVLLELAGTANQFGGLEATFGFQGADNSFTPYLRGDGTAVKTTSRGGFRVDVPRSGQVGVSLNQAPVVDGANVALILDAVKTVILPP